MLEVTVGADPTRELVSTTLWTYKMSSGTGNLIIYFLKMQRSSALMQIWLTTVDVFVRQFEVRGCRPCAVRYSVFLRTSRSCM